MFDHIVREPICEHLSWQWGNGDSCTLTLQYVSEVFEVGVAAADYGMTKFEGGDVGAGVDFVGGVHVTRGGAMSLWVLYLLEESASERFGGA